MNTLSWSAAVLEWTSLVFRSFYPIIGDDILDISPYRILHHLVIICRLELIKVPRCSR